MAHDPAEYQHVSPDDDPPGPSVVAARLSGPAAADLGELCAVYAAPAGRTRDGGGYAVQRPADLRRADAVCIGPGAAVFARVADHPGRGRARDQLRARRSPVDGPARTHPLRRALPRLAADDGVYAQSHRVHRIYGKHTGSQP